MKLHENRQLFADAVRVTSETMGIAPEFVEKDYWICQILQNLSRHQDSGSMVWKGGTSLSKAYSLIQRFSSDVDFAVVAEGLSQNQLKKLVTRIGKETTADLTEIEVEGQTHKSTRYRKTYHQYESVITERNARYSFLGNHVVVEINTYGNPYPYVKKEIHPFITDMMVQRGLNDMIHECMEYLKTEFAQNLLELIEHDKREYDRPPLWSDADLRTSILFTGFNSLWQKIAPQYQTEVGALSYGEMPDKEEIATSTKELLELVIEIIAKGGIKDS